ncbi:MAG: hypothetical protein MUE56_07730 [Ignavibacteria bacterium]|jgi:hypothetical protein|nr:hypothetical protein [Ignavibacteria bacterium]
MQNAKGKDEKLKPIKALKTLNECDGQNAKGKDEELKPLKALKAQKKRKNNNIYIII